MTRELLLLGVSAGILGAQTQNNSFYKLDNGATVLYQIYSGVDTKDPKRNFGTIEKSGNTIRRMMLDEKGKPWLGFELHFDLKPGASPTRFNLSMEPLGGWNFFGQKAAAREIENGDHVLLAVVEEPLSGRKVFDSFSVGIGVALPYMPMTRTIPQMPEAGTFIHLKSPRFKGQNDSLIGESDLSVDGSAVSISSHAEGRFSFSAAPLPGFRMEAIAEGNLLAFTYNGKMFFVQCAGPVVDGVGSRYLWVRRDTGGGPSLPTIDLSVK